MKFSGFKLPDILLEVKKVPHGPVFLNCTNDEDSISPNSLHIRWKIKKNYSWKMILNSSPYRSLIPLGINTKLLFRKELDLWKLWKNLSIHRSGSRADIDIKSGFRNHMCTYPCIYLLIFFSFPLYSEYRYLMWLSDNKVIHDFTPPPPVIHVLLEYCQYAKL